MLPFLHDRVPPQPLELQPLHLPAMRARHEVSSLIRGLILTFDARQALDGRRRDQKQLLAMTERGCTRLGKGNGITFAVHVTRIGVNLVKEDVACRHRSEPRGTVGARQHQLPTGKAFRQYRVP